MRCVWDHLFLRGCFCGDCPIFTIAPSRHEPERRCNWYGLLSGIHVLCLWMAVRHFGGHMADSNFAQNENSADDNHSNNSINRYFVQNEDDYDYNQAKNSNNYNSSNTKAIIVDYENDDNGTIVIILRLVTTTLTISEVIYEILCISGIVIGFVRLWPGALWHVCCVRWKIYMTIITMTINYW